MNTTSRRPLTPEQLAGARFPLGDLTKAEVRETVETFASLVCPFLDDFDQFLSQHVFVS